LLFAIFSHTPCAVMLRLPTAALSRRWPPVVQDEGELFESSPAALGADSGRSRSSSVSECATDAPVEKSSLSLAVCRQQLPCVSSAYDIDCGEILGRGGAGIVRLAQQRGDGALCAVKEVPKAGLGGRGAAMREAKILQTLDHPGICRLLDTFEDDESVHLVLEYIDGRELFNEILEHRHPDERRARDVIGQLFQALGYCHEAVHDVVHRDVKPENIMLRRRAVTTDRLHTTSSEVVLIDFGVAIVAGRQHGGHIGTLPYLAPEAVADAADACGPALDLWSAGIVLYAMLTGDLPSARVRAGLESVDVAGNPLSAAGISSAAQNLLAGLLRAQPQERLTAAQAAEHPWVREVSCSLKAPPMQIATGATEQMASPRLRALAVAFGQLADPPHLRALKGQFLFARDPDEQTWVHRDKLAMSVAVAVPMDGASSPGCIAEVFDALDVQGSGRINYAEWLEWLELALQDAEKGTGEDSHAIFNAFDQKCDSQTVSPSSKLTAPQVALPSAATETMATPIMAGLVRNVRCRRAAHQGRRCRPRLRSSCLGGRRRRLGAGAGQKQAPPSTRPVPVTGGLPPSIGVRARGCDERAVEGRCNPQERRCSRPGALGGA